MPRRRKAWQELAPRTLALWVLLLGLAVALLLAAAQGAYNRLQAEAAFGRAAVRTAQALTDRMASYEYGLRGARGVAIAAWPVALDHQRFHLYHQSRDLALEFPGARGFGYVHRLVPAAEAAWLAALRRSNAPGFRIQALAPHNGERFVVQFIEPDAGNAEALGLDLASEPRRRAAAERAMRTGRAAITEPITLAQARGSGPQGFLVMLPVYAPDVPQPDGRQPPRSGQTVIGWTYVALVLTEVLRGLDLHADDVSLALDDVAPGQPPQRFYSSAAANTAATAAPAPATDRLLALGEPPQQTLLRQVFGRQWRLQMQATPLFMARLNLVPPGVLLALGGAVSVLLSALAFSRQLSRQRAAQLQRDQAANAQQLREFNATLERQVRERSAAFDAARRHLQTILDTLPSMVAFWDRDGINRFANRAHQRWYGIDPTQMPGRSFAEVFGADWYARNQPQIEAVLRGEPQLFERATDLPDGSGQWHALVHYLPEKTNGELTGFYVLVHDVTELHQSRRRLAALLLENEGLLSAIRTHAIYSVTDAQGRITDVNERFCELSGRPREALIGADHRVLSSGQHAPDFWRQVWAQLGAGQVWRGELCNRALDGSLYWEEAIITPFYGTDGALQKYIALGFDITARKTAQQRQAESEAILERAGRLAGVGAWSFELASGRITWSAETRRIHEVGPDFKPQLADGLGFYQAQSRPLIRAAVQAAIERGESWDLELPFTTALGRDRWVRTAGEARYAPGAPPGAAPVALVGAFQDITERRQADEALRRLAAAEAASAAKSAFLANVSHEIRTPMNAVIGLSHLLADTPLNDDQRGLVNKLGSASRALMGVISSVLDLSKIEAGELVLEARPFNLAELLHELVGLLQPQAEAKGLALVLAPLPDLPPLLVGDDGRLRQVLSNLLANAVKFTEQGQVQLALALLSANDEGLQLRCTVSDTGIGISEEAQARLFTPFMQADASTTRRYGGTGLGLSIVRRLVQLMGGEVGVISSPGEGSQFWFTLALRRLPADVAAEHPDAALAGATATAVAAAGPAATPPQLPGVQVLVVDDSALNLEVARRLLVREGAVVTTCGDAAAALALLAQAQAVDLVLMDVQMPGMDGCEATQRLRELPGRAALPVVAVTAGALQAERQRALDAGMNAFVSKPLQPQLLVRTIASLVAQAHGQAQAQAQAQAQGQAPGQAGPPTGDVATVTRPPGDVSRLQPQPEPEPAGPPQRLPAIAGIDASQAVLGMAADPRLFGELLQRLFDDYPDLMQPSAPTPLSGAARRALAARLHKFRGHAGLIGASALLAQAGQAEQLLTGHANSAGVPRLLSDLSQSLQALRQASSVWFAAQPVAPPLGAPPAGSGVGSVAPGERAAVAGAAAAVAGVYAAGVLAAAADGLAAAPAGPAAALLPAAPGPGLAPLLPAPMLTDWCEALRLQELAALDQFERLLPLLRARLTPDQLQGLQQALHRLDFAAALQLLTDAQVAQA